MFRFLPSRQAEDAYPAMPRRAMTAALRAVKRQELLRKTYLRKMKEGGWDDELAARALIGAMKATYG